MAKIEKRLYKGRDGGGLLLMCKDTPVYDITTGKILDSDKVPGAIFRGTQTFGEWAKTRYSAGTNVSARRLMLRAFGSDNHNTAQKVTRSLSLTDCYWLKSSDERVAFADVTPYLHNEWNGTDKFTGGSIATLFTNGASDKLWLDKNTLYKKGASSEPDAYAFCVALGLTNIVKAKAVEGGVYLDNFTSPDAFFESMEQSGFVGEDGSPQEIFVDKFGEEAVKMFVADYLMENDDRHWGNYGFMRDANTGAYLGMAPLFDFDWAWSGGVVALPENAKKYKSIILMLCDKALLATERFPKRENIIRNRAAELKEMFK